MMFYSLVRVTLSSVNRSAASRTILKIPKGLIEAITLNSY